MESSAVSLFIRHVPAFNERRLNSMFVDGFVRMKHKYVTKAVSPTLRVADSLYPHYCSLLVQTELFHQYSIYKDFSNK